MNIGFGLNKANKSLGDIDMAGIASGQQHTMIQSKDGSLYSWGLGLSGQLGFTYEEIHKNDVRIAQINHPLVNKIDYRQRVQFGLPTFKPAQSPMPRSPAGKFNQDIPQEQLQLEKNEPDGIYLYDQHYWIPFLPSPAKINLPFVVKNVACGAFHSMILTQEGQIYGCGLASSGQLGIIEESLADNDQPCSLLYAEFTAVPLESASGIIQLECGDDFTLALSQSGNVYSTGSGAFGIHG